MGPEKLWWLSVRLYRRGLRRLARVIKTVNFLLYKTLLPPEADIQPDVELWHLGLGTVVHPNVKIGRNVEIGHGVTIAGTTNNGPMVIGDGVKIAAHAILIPRGGEPLSIGDNAVIGAGAVVNSDVPAGSVFVGRAAVETAGSRESRSSMS